MKIKDEISGLMDDWHAGAHHRQGALGRGWELCFPVRNCNATPFPRCFCLNTGLYRGTLLLRQPYSPQRRPPHFGEGAAFSPIPPLRSWPVAGAGAGGGCWSPLRPCASLPRGTGHLPPQEGKGSCAGLAASPSTGCWPQGCSRRSGGLWRRLAQPGVDVDLSDPSPWSPHAPGAAAVPERGAAPLPRVPLAP